MKANNKAVADKVLGIVGRMLGPDITENQPLMEAGLDSLGAVELRTSLQDAFGFELPATLTFDYPSVAALSNFIVSLQRDPISPATTQASS